MAILPSSLNFPPSSATVSVKIFNSFKRISVPSPLFFSAAPTDVQALPQMSRQTLSSGKSFLIEHPNGSKVVFDLGCRKDTSTAAKIWRDRVESGQTPVDYGPDVAETLAFHGVDLKSINAVIWSHPHGDHVGNPSTFPPSTALVIGPGVQAAFRPGYPLNPNAMLPESDFEGRDVVEVTFTENAPLIGGLKTYDYFGDGSFYLLDAPGHCIGHILGLARTTPSPDASWILFAGDAAHHPAMIRPSPYIPFPSDLEPLVPPALANCARDRPFLDLPKKEYAIHHNWDAAAEVVEVLKAIDARNDVWVIMSHDGSMDFDARGKGKGRMRWMPDVANEWREEGVKEWLFWKYLESRNPENRWE